MSLSQRVGAIEPTSEGGTSEASFKRLIRERLYEKIPPQGVAQLVSQSPTLARRELLHLIRESIAEMARDEYELKDHAENPAWVEDIQRSLLNDIMGMGPIDSLLADPSVTEIMVNGTQVFLERGGRIHASDIKFDDDEHVRLIIDRIIAPIGRRLDERTPLVNARLAEGHRVHAVIPPISMNGPILTIRKFRSTIYALPELVALGTLPSQMARFLRWAVKGRLNIAVTGGTGSGKTTLLNALSMEIPQEERIITIEDSAELRFQTHPHVVALEARPPSLEGTGEITIRELVANSLRMRPDRIVVGEVRAGEALDMLQAMNTGHDGSLTTLHANSPKDAISRLATLVRYAVDIPLEAINAQIFSALDLIVHQTRTAQGTRMISEIVACDDGELSPILRFEEGRYVFNEPTHILNRFLSLGILDASKVGRWVDSCLSL